MNWTHETLADVAEVLGGQSPPSAEVNDVGRGLPFFQGKAEFGRRHPTPRKWCATPARTAAPGDVLLSIRAPVGPTNLAAVHCGIGRGLAAVRPGPRTTSAWLTYWIQFSADELRKKATGSTFEAVTIGQVKAHPIPVPTVDEQRRIVGAIETHFSRLDAAVASLTRAKANVKRARASVLMAAVEGRLVPTEATLARAEGRAYEPASVLLDRMLVERKAAWAASGARGKYQEPVKPETEGLPGLPEGWCWASIGALALDGFTNGLYVPKAQYGTGVPILRIDDFQDDWSRSAGELRRVNIDEATRSQYGLATGQLVINRVNSLTHLGKSLAIEDRHLPAVFESNMMRATIHHGCLVAFLTSWLRSRPGRTQLLKDAKWAVNQASINQGDVARTPVPFPPLAEQHRIVAEVDRRLSVLDALDATLAANLARCTRLRQSILKRAFEGRLVPAEAPATQPALLGSASNREATP